MITFPIVCFALFNPVSAKTIEVVEGEDLFTVLEDLEAGDEVVVHEGTYSTQSGSGSWYRSLELYGTEKAPIVIRAADGESVVISGDPDGSQNIINIAGEYYTWSGFEMLYGSHGIRVKTTAHATFENLDIHDTADVGFSCNVTDATYEDLTIRGNEIHDTNGTGECFYLGCNSDGCQMWDSVIEFNYCHDTLNTTQGDGIELKTGSYNVTIRHNVIHDVNYPAITMYGTLDRGTNIVEGNVIWNTGDNGIQLVGDAIVRNNLVMNATYYGIYSKSSQEENPDNLEIVHNTVVNGSGTCFRANDWDKTDVSDVVVANNAFLCDGGTAIHLPDGGGPASFSQNGVLGSSDASSGVFSVDLDDVLDADGRDLYPSEGSALKEAGDTSYGTTEDYNCLTRDDGRPDVGAYERSETTNPGGAVSEAFKACVESGGDTGGADTDDGDSGEDPSDSGDPDDSDTDNGDTDNGEPDTDDGFDDETDVHIKHSGCGCAAASHSWVYGWLLICAAVVVRRRNPDAAPTGTST